MTPSQLCPLARRLAPFIAAAALLLVTVVPAFAGAYNRVLDIGAPMPSFTDLPTADDSTLSSSDLGEDVVVLVFLANHCPWVRGMDPDLVALSKELAGKSVRIVGVSVNHRQEDRLPAMKEHAAKYGYDFPYVFDESQELGRALGATRTPEYFVFDKTRKLVYMGAIHDSPARVKSDGSIAYTRGEPTTFYVRDAVLATLGDQPVPTAETAAQGCSVEYEQHR
ncbi:MAG: thioredoxin family protein [Acidobacteria bacterium]|nr:thioredoxin family protein [Acidobacteriota bacterium]